MNVLLKYFTTLPPGAALYPPTNLAGIYHKLRLVHHPLLFHIVIILKRIFIQYDANRLLFSRLQKHFPECTFNSFSGLFGNSGCSSLHIYLRHFRARFFTGILKRKTLPWPTARPAPLSNLHMQSGCMTTHTQTDIAAPPHTYRNNDTPHKYHRCNAPSFRRRDTRPAYARDNLPAASASSPAAYPTGSHRQTGCLPAHDRLPSPGTRPGSTPSPGLPMHAISTGPPPISTTMVLGLAFITACINSFCPKGAFSYPVCLFPPHHTHCRSIRHHYNHASSHPLQSPHPIWPPRRRLPVSKPRLPRRAAFLTV